MAATSRTPASVLQELCVQRKITPVYNIDDDHSPTPKKFICQVTCDSLTAVGDGRSKKEAKHAAAEKMLQLIRGTNEPQQCSNTSTVPSPYEGKVKEDSVGPLADFCTEYGIKVPEYVNTRAEGPPHATMFTFRCTVGSFHTEAIERTKQAAKQLAAMYMLNRLKKIVDERTKLKLPDISFVDPSQEPDYRKANTLLSNGNFSEFKKILAGNLTHPLRTDFIQFKNLFPEDSEIPFPKDTEKSIPQDSEISFSKDSESYFPKDSENSFPSDTENLFPKDTDNYEEIHNMICNYNDEDALSTLISILDKADYKYTLIPVESVPNVCAVILNIDCSPNLNILDTGSTYVESCHNVAVKTLKYLKILCFPKKRCFEECEENIDFETLINVKKKSC